MLKKIISSILLSVILLATFSCLSGCSLFGSNIKKETEQMLQSYNELNENLRNIESHFYNESGHVNENDIPSLFSLVEKELVELEENKEIKEFERNENCIYIELNSGVGYIYSPTVENLSNSGTQNSIITLEPYYSSDDGMYWHVEGDEDNVSLFDRIATQISQFCENYTFSPEGNINDSNVTLESLKKFGQNEVVIWFAHGNYSKKHHSYIATGEKPSLETLIKYHDELIDKTIVFWFHDRICVNGKFFEKHYNKGDMDGSFFYLANCESGRDSFLADVLLSKGAEAVVANTQTIYTQYNVRMCNEIFSRMTYKSNEESFYNIKESIEYAQSIHGKYDSYDGGTDTHHAEVTVFGNASYQLIKDGYMVDEDFSSNNSNVDVEDAVNYSKEVIVDPQMAEMGWDAQGMTHDVRLPKLSSETANAKAFNQKLYNTFGEQYEQLLNNQEANHLLMCDYESKVHNGIIGIAIETNVGAQGAGANSYYYAFYYDTNLDKELTFDEYLDALGLNSDILSSRIKNTSMYNDFYSYISDYNDVYVKDCILGDDGSIVYMNDTDTMMGWNRLDVESLLK